MNRRFVVRALVRLKPPDRLKPGLQTGRSWPRFASKSWKFFLPMKIVKPIAVILIGWTLSEPGSAAPFQNLGFEEARTNGLTFFSQNIHSFGYPRAGFGTTVDLLPGWRLLSESSSEKRELATMGFNFPSGLGQEIPPGLASFTSIIDEGYPGWGSIEGYTLDFFRDPSDFSKGGMPHFSIVQLGDVPLHAVYLTFRSRLNYFAASIDGVDLPSNVDYFATGYFWADVSQYAGRTVELKFRTYDPFLPRTGHYELDSISFAIPEPSTTPLIALGLGIIGWRWRRRRFA